MTTIVNDLARFAAEATTDSIPSEVVRESKRILLDSVGCAIASLGDEASRRGVRYAKLLGGSLGEARILGTSEMSSVPAAAFANAELINGLDQDAVLPPGHVSPYVLPGTLAAAEWKHVSGERLLCAIAVSHEMAFRLGKATDYLRDVKDGQVSIPKVIGYSSTLFGGAAGVAMSLGLNEDGLANTLGIMGSTMPANTQRAWMMHAPPTTIKYQLPGSMALATVTAAMLADLGHIGDRKILDDREYGFPRFIGTARWEPSAIIRNLGEEWTFPPSLSFKPYPHCRVMHAPFDALLEILEANDLKPDEIDQITAWGESFVFQPTWVNEHIRNPRDAQFSMTHGLALAAHRFPRGKEWQDPVNVFDPSVMGLMERSSFNAHPEHANGLTKDPAARRSRVEVKARGEVFVEDRIYPKGSPSSDPETYMTDSELLAKFKHNVSGVLSAQRVNEVAELIFQLENVADVADFTELLTPDE